MGTPLSNAVPLTGNPQIDGLVQGGAWQSAAPGAATTLTYSFSLSDDPADPLWSAYPLVRQAVAQAFQQWANVANLTFQELGSGVMFNQTPADIAVMLASEPTDLLGLGIFPDPSFADQLLGLTQDYTRATYPKPEGDVVFNVGASVMSDVSAGRYGFAVLLHEIGHALGLKHPYDDGVNNRPTFGALGISELDKVTYTVMSDTDAYGGHQFFGTQPSTPMPLDILAIQHIYGANLSFHAGDDRYVLANETVVRTLWDAGGVDTIDASGLAQSATIDLRAGHETTSGGLSLWMAYGTTIENVVGTKHGDSIHGNDANNVLDESFSSLRSSLHGGKGDDLYIVGNSADDVFEAPGEGLDTVRVVTSATWGTFTLAANVENLVLTGAANINGVGNDAANIITGNEGNNVLTGAGGDDRIDGGAGVDRMVGGAGNDIYVVGEYLPAAPNAGIYAYGDVGDYITGGSSYLYAASAGNLDVTATDLTGDGVVDTVSAYFLGNTLGVFYHFNVSTRELGQNLALGAYSDARRYPFEGSGHAGLNFDLNGRGSNTLTGEFTVNAVDIDYSGAMPRLVRFSVSFEQHSEGLTAASYGTFNYNYDGAAALEPEYVVELPNEGNDTVESSITYTLPANVENLVLTGSADIDGTGNSADNVLTGNSGINVLRGGAGNDTYIVQNAGDVAIENASEGIDTIVTPFAFTLAGSHFENVTYTGWANLDAQGTADDNVFVGNAGLNAFAGGAGNDTYVIQNTGDTVSENAGEGVDTVKIEAGYFDGAGNFASSYTLPGNVENATYLGRSAFALTGNALDNVLTGGGQSDRIAGLGGNDTIDGGPGYDTSIFSGSQASYTVLHRGTTLVVGDANAGTSSTLFNVERVSFADSFLLSKTAPTQLDFGSDGRSELLMRNATTGLVQLWSMDGTHPGVASDVAVAGGDWTIVGNGDFNGDGRGDILWRDGTGLLATWEMDQSTLLAGSTVQVVANDWKVAGSGNFNSDVYNDILWRNDNGQVGLWEMKGSSFLAASVIVTGTPHDEIPTNWQIQGTGDFNGDGKADILWRDYSTGDMGVWEMFGSTIAGATVVDAPPPTSWTIVGMGDFNNDHRTDVLWRNGNELNVWLMDGGHSIQRGPLETVGANQTVVGVGDISGDGRADILLQDNAGTLSAHLIDGLSVIAQGNVGTIGSDWVLT